MPRPRASLVKFDPPLALGPASASETTNTIAGQLDQRAPVPPREAKPGVEDVLAALLPPREWVEDGIKYVQHVSTQPATRLDVVQLQEALDQRLLERQAREGGICPVREELYGQCFDELIRQVALDSAERGLLLLRVRDEIRLTIAAYQTLFQSSVTFGTRKQLLSEQGKHEQQQQIDNLEEEKRQLEGRVVELRAKVDAIERREAERRAIAERKRKEELEFLKHQGTHLESFLKSVQGQ